jgi:hypothetical protein
VQAPVFEQQRNKYTRRGQGTTIKVACDFVLEEFFYSGKITSSDSCPGALLLIQIPDRGGVAGCIAPYSSGGDRPFCAFK